MKNSEPIDKSEKAECDHIADFEIVIFWNAIALWTFEVLDFEMWLHMRSWEHDVLSSNNLATSSEDE